MTEHALHTPPDLVYVNPESISKVMNPRAVGKAVCRRILRPDASPEVLEGEWDTPVSRPFEKTAAYEDVRDRCLGNIPWTSTRRLARLVTEIKSGRVQWGYRSAAEYLERGEKQIVQLFESIRDGGYKS